MDIERLTKSQIVLLTLLISFVTSIATGIVTVSLLDQAPPVITQSVSRIVRETVRNAVPAAISQPAAAAKPAPEPAPITEPSLSSRIAQANRSIVQLYSGTDDAPVFLGLGVVVDEGGTIVTDSDALGALENAHAVVVSGSSTPVSVSGRDLQSGIIYLSPVSSSTRTFLPAIMAGDAPAIGDTSIAFAGKSALRIASGLVVGTDAAKGVIDTSIDATSIIKGSPIINTEGQFVGISTGVSRIVNPASFMLFSKTDPHSADAQAP